MLGRCIDLLAWIRQRSLFARHSVWHIPKSLLLVGARRSTQLQQEGVSSCVLTCLADGRRLPANPLQVDSPSSALALGAHVYHFPNLFYGKRLLNTYYSYSVNNSKLIREHVSISFCSCFYNRCNVRGLASKTNPDQRAKNIEAS